MGLADALAVLNQQWPDIRTSLASAEATRLDELVVALASEANPVQSEEYGHEISDMLSRSLPREHPFRRALAQETPRSLATTNDPVALSEWQDLSESLDAHVDRPNRPPRRSEVASRARDWLLNVPTFKEPDLRIPRSVLYGPGLIRLDDAFGNLHWPAFQFADRQPRPEVVAINQLFDADDDPWGVADWWLGVHRLIGEPPVALLDRGEHRELYELAQRELPGM